MPWIIDASFHLVYQSTPRYDSENEYILMNDFNVQLVLISCSVRYTLMDFVYLLMKFHTTFNIAANTILFLRNAQFIVLNIIHWITSKY